MDTFGLSSLHGLADLGMRGGVDMRPTLLRVLTDLYVQKLGHTPDEERHYTELALRLLDAVDVATRTAVAARLARHLSPPLRIIDRLARDLPEVAAALQSHPLLQPSEAADETAQHSPVVPIAQAAPPPERKPDPEPVANPPDAMDAAAAAELNDMFFAAPANERRLILINLDVVAPMSGQRAGVSYDATLLQRLETTALARNRDGFAEHLAALLHIPHAQAQRIVRDDLGEPLVVAAKALAMPRDVLYRILMFVNPAVGHSVERVHALAELYDEMTTGAAADMVATWQALRKNERAAAKHQPLFWNDESRVRARPAAATRRAPAAPAASRPGERRDAS